MLQKKLVTKSNDKKKIDNVTNYFKCAYCVYCITHTIFYYGILYII